MTTERAIEIFDNSRKHADNVKSKAMMSESKQALDEFIKACTMAIEALEKQIPKKVKHITKKRRPITLFLETYDVLVCEACGEEVLCEEDYCHHCGQALDWSEE